jgi:hypothetical protein
MSLGHVHYGLLFTDRFFRMTYIYPLQNLTNDIIKQMAAFFAHLGTSPKCLISDFDTMLIGGKAGEYLNSLKIHLNAAPANTQDKNRLVERHWQTMMDMTWNWLASTELPATFWYYAVKRVAEVCNYFPMQLPDGQWTTPLEMAYCVKPDLRVFFKLFSVAAVQRECQGNMHLGKFVAQSTPMIVSPNSTGLQFYSPSNGTFVSSIDYKLQLNVSSGSFFGLQYQPGVFIYRIDESNTIFAPTYQLDSSVYIHIHSPPSLAKVIGIPTHKSPDIYTVVFPDGSISKYSSSILNSAPSTSSSMAPMLLPSWIKGGANATLFLTHMAKPHHGILNMVDINWMFYPGKSKDGNSLPDLQDDFQQLLDSGQLFKGHAKFKNVYDTRNQLSLCELSLFPKVAILFGREIGQSNDDILLTIYDDSKDKSRPVTCVSKCYL